MTIRIAALSDVGLARSDNQDHVLVRRDGEKFLLVVCDGMGGHAGGSIASRLAAEAFVRAIDLTEPVDESTMARGVEAATFAVGEGVAADPALNGMGTTLVAASLRDGDLLIVNVGDSRAYLHSGDDLQRVTDDHSVVYEMVKRGELTEEEAERHPRRNVITQAIDGTARIKPDFFRSHLGPGDRLLLCSDGLSSMVGRDTISSILKVGDDPESVCDELVKSALHAGGNDNVSVIVAIATELSGAAEIDRETPTGEGLGTRRGTRWWHGIGGWGPMALVVSLIAIMVTVIWFVWIEPASMAPNPVEPRGRSSSDSTDLHAVEVDTASGDSSTTQSVPAWGE